jgi:UDP-glucose 4-epimerase
MKTKSRVLVAGGSGFLGSHIADALTERGYEVTVFDIKSSPYLRKNQKMVVGDITDEKLVNKIVKGMTYVYNVAGIADIDECHNRPIETVKFNILGNAYILDACVKHKVKKFLFASSAYVYSDSGSFYKISKQASELLIEGYYDRFGLNYVILRYGSLYGERADNRNSIHRMIEEALTKHVINYGGEGNEKREFIHVQDAAKLSVDVLDDQYNNQNIILTGNTAIEYSDLLNMIKEMMHNKIKINYGPRKSETHYKLTPYSFNPRLGRKLINNPHIDLGQGILNVINEIHQKLHPELKEKFGLLIKEKQSR